MLYGRDLIPHLRLMERAGCQHRAIDSSIEGLALRKCERCLALFNREFVAQAIRAAYEADPAVKLARKRAALAEVARATEPPEWLAPNLYINGKSKRDQMLSIRAMRKEYRE